jgi:hypothetical protein
MGPTALLPFRKEGLLKRFYFALKNPDGFGGGFEPTNFGF